MRLKIMPKNSFQCLVYSVAMVLDVDIDILFDEMGHKGNLKIWPKLSEPLCYNNFHIQELIDCCIRRGKGLIPIEALPVSKSVDSIMIQKYYPFKDAEARFIKHISGRVGVLLGETSEGIGHAAAWDGYKVYDPNGTILNNPDFAIRECWLLI